MSSTIEITNGDEKVYNSPVSARGTRLEIKRIDKACIPSTGKWVVTDSSELEPENRVDEYAAYDEYAFIIQRTIIQQGGSGIPTFSVATLIQSDCLRWAVKEVTKNVQKLSLHSQPLKLDSQLLLAFLPQFQEHLAQLHRNDVPTDQEKTTAHLSFFIDFLKEEYAAKLLEIRTFTSHGEITFDLLWSIFLPQSIIFTLCETTSEPRAVRLRGTSLATRFMTNEQYWKLDCEYVEGADGSAGQIWTLATMSLEISHFEGVEKITNLKAYPIEWHSNKDEVQAKILERGRRWLLLAGVHHRHYSGMASRISGTRVKVDGRIMIDLRTFADSNPNHWHKPRSLREHFFNYLLNNDDSDLDASQPDLHTAKSMQATDIGDVDILLATPILYGFSLTEKLWLKFNVEHVSSIKWNDEAFKNIALDPDRKVLIQSLVDSHTQDYPFDDFVQGKGRGLIINLSGPPGVGKTLTVEATSEHLHKPLYIVGAGELGTDPSTLEGALTNIFALVPVWNAVVLIDEADVFLEERGVADVKRNAMVAVFLRQLEYFRGILFLTTNRVKTFDQAFESRIHLSLHYAHLSQDAKEHIWRAFLEKAGNTSPGLQYPTMAELRELSKQELNGRQIKNVIKLAVTLANHLNEPLGFKHLSRTLNIMEDPQQGISSTGIKADFRSIGYFGFGFLSACAFLYVLQVRSK